MEQRVPYKRDIFHVDRVNISCWSYQQFAL